MKKIIIVGICVVLFLSLIGCENSVSNSEDQKEWTDEEIDELIERADAVLNRDKDEVIDKRVLVIQEGWTNKTDENYIRTEGRVTNNGDKTIRYFKITAQYLNKDRVVLDSSYTNSNQRLRPGDSKEFSISNKHNDEYDGVRIFVEEVVLE